MCHLVIPVMVQSWCNQMCHLVIPVVVSTSNGLLRPGEHLRGGAAAWVAVINGGWEGLSVQRYGVGQDNVPTRSAYEAALGCKAAAGEVPWRALGSVLNVKGGTNWRPALGSRRTAPWGERETA